MKKVVFTLIAGLIMFYMLPVQAQSKGKTIIIKQYQQNNGEWISDTIGNLDFNKILDFDFNHHLDQNIARLDSLLPDLSVMDSMLSAFNKQMMGFDASIAHMSKLIASKVPNINSAALKFDSLVESKLSNTQIKIVTGNNLKKVLMINGNKIEIKQDIDENIITLTFYTDEAGEFSIQLLNIENEILYKSKENIEPGKHTHVFSTKNYNSGTYLIKLQHNHLFLLEQMQIMHN